MKTYLDFKPAQCKNCYKCLRECPVKAISVVGHQARIIEDRCILCGTCASVCPQNAKHVHNDTDEVKKLLSSGAAVAASVAPSFVSSFKLKDFSVMKIALGKLGFTLAEETAIGANTVVGEYKKLLAEGSYKNFITSACPAINRMIQLYYPNALPYLAKVDTPMIAHAKLLKRSNPDVKVVFVGPCIAKKREASESGLIDAVLTFEDLNDMFESSGINLKTIAELPQNGKGRTANRAKYFPIHRGIIKSFEELPSGYEYIAVDGIKKCADVLENVETVSGLFLELSACDYSCVKGPCSLLNFATAIKGNSDIRNYVNKDLSLQKASLLKPADDLPISARYNKLDCSGSAVPERIIREILAKTGKFKPEDELNCGACGYSTCREKAWAVANGFADVEMCLPYMRDRAETMSYEIIQNSPDGVIAVDFDLNIIEMSKMAHVILGIDDRNTKGKPLVDYFNPTDFMLAKEDEKRVSLRNVKIHKTNKTAELTVTVLKEQRVMFGIFKDITDKINYDNRLSEVRMETIATADEVIQKQMRVAQEIAGLLGETTAETKVVLLKLKKALSQPNDGDKK